jgi:hypothetical protein
MTTVAMPMGPWLNSALRSQVGDLGWNLERGEVAGADRRLARD